jgi:hypothetical protein
MAILLKADGTMAQVIGRLTVPVMQTLVGGYIEIVTIGSTLTKHEILIVDEEGLLKDKLINVRATRLYRGIPPRHNGIIVGDAIHCEVLNPGQDTEHCR